MPRFYLWLNGAACEGGGKPCTIRNPFDCKEVAEASVAEKKQIKRALSSSTKAFYHIRTTPRFARAEWLERIAKELDENYTEIVDTLIMEGGKPRMFAEQEVDRSIDVFHWAAEECRRFTGEQLPIDGMSRGKGYDGHTLREPIGPIFGICPFNFPLNLVAHKIAPALAAGNSIIIKPASNTPISALILARLASEAGVPPGGVNVLPMRHADTAMLFDSPAIKLISFTGSAEVGWQIKAAARKQRVILELGGNSGSIVAESADIEWAATRLALGGFAQAGQSCIAVQRIYAHQHIYDEFLKALKRATRQLRAGDPRDADTIVGPMIDEQAVERAESIIAKAKEQGARVVCGGKRLPLGCGNILEPTILSDVHEEMRAQKEEVFAPIITVSKVEHVTEAIRLINSSRFGLQAALFSNDLSQIQLSISDLQAGGVVINDFPTLRVDMMPYGGIKDSGLGREGIRSAMLEMSNEKTVLIRNPTHAAK